MGIIEVLLIGIGLAMDAFAVSICKGLSMKKLNLKKSVIIGLYFGIFQAVMPIIGFFLGKGFENLVIQIDHWIAFFLLLLIGANMIKEVFGKEEKVDDDIGFKTMIMLAVATSIDALACRNNICVFRSRHMDFSIFNWTDYICYIDNRSFYTELNLEISLKKDQNYLEV